MNYILFLCKSKFNIKLISAAGDITPLQPQTVIILTIFYKTKNIQHQCYLPSPLIDGQDTSFTTHFVGGGLFTGLFWVYLVSSMKWRAHWLVMAFSVFALVSALGCVNELAELFMVKVGLASIKLDDTNWDILANTLGAATVWIGWIIADFMMKKGRLSGDSGN